MLYSLSFVYLLGHPGPLRVHFLAKCAWLSSLVPIFQLDNVDTLKSQTWIGESVAESLSNHWSRREQHSVQRQVHHQLWRPLCFHPARRVNLPKSTASRKTSAATFLIGELNTRIRKSLSPVRQLGALTTPPLPVAFTSVSYHSPFPMAHRRRQLMGVCAARRGRVPLQPHDANQRPPAQKVDLMVSFVAP